MPYIYEYGCECGEITEFRLPPDHSTPVCVCGKKMKRIYSGRVLITGCPTIRG